MAASVLASLPARTDTAAAVAPVKHDMASINITGQYLYERFIADHDGDSTRMNIVRAAVSNVDTATFGKALRDAVEIAKKSGPAAEKTMRNHMTVCRIAYGALKFAQAHCNMLGIDNKTGYQQMRVLGKQALEKAGIKWDGSKAPTKQEQESAKIDKAQAVRLAEIRTENPQQDGEEPAKWEIRCRGLLAAELAEDAGKGLERLMARAAVVDLANRIENLCGNTLKDVMQILLNRLGDDLVI